MHKSLVFKYLIIVVGGLFFFPIVIPIILGMMYQGYGLINDLNTSPYESQVIQKSWQKEVQNLSSGSPNTIRESIEIFSERYPEASFFWVDQTGNVQYELNVTTTIPKNWSPSYTVQFMKQNTGTETDLFTVVSFIGNDPSQGFLVIQIPRDVIIAQSGTSLPVLFPIIGVMIAFILFIFISWLFFNRIRKRLLNLKDTMENRSENGLPMTVDSKTMDEIGQLETSFNRMVSELELSRQREKQEEQLRRDLIANLSHDLRTPLTTIRSHAYSLHTEHLSSQGKASLQLIDSKVHYVGQLMDNLFSFTLLSAGKYPYQPLEIDIHRIVRRVVAEWYPVFEKEGFEIVIELTDTQVIWTIDEQWFERVLDNIFQNTLRHAAGGKYVRISTSLNHDGNRLTIEDHGPGLSADSSEKGAGIGLSIVKMMLKEMNLNCTIDSNEKGSRFIISNTK